MAMDSGEILKTVMAAQQAFYQSLAEVRKEALDNVQAMQTALLDTFNRAHGENKEALDRIATLLEKQNGRIGKLERWRTGIVYVLGFIQIAWASFLAYMGWKR